MHYKQYTVLSSILQTFMYVIEHTLWVICPPTGCFPTIERSGCLQVGQNGSCLRASLRQPEQNWWPHLVRLGFVNLSKQMGQFLSKGEKVHVAFQVRPTLYIMSACSCRYQPKYQSFQNMIHLLPSSIPPAALKLLDLWLSLLWWCPCEPWPSFLPPLPPEVKKSNW